MCTCDNSVTDILCFMCGTALPEIIPSTYASADGTYVTQLTLLPKSQCGVPGCNKDPCYYGFCSPRHSELAVKKRWIPSYDANVVAVFLGDTMDYTAHILKSDHP